MTQYQCTVLFDASAGVDIEANSPEEAANIAEDTLSGVQNLCHQCSDALSTGDSIGVLVYQGDVLVAETGFHADQLVKVTAERDEAIGLLKRCHEGFSAFVMGRKMARRDRDALVQEISVFLGVNHLKGDRS